MRPRAALAWPVLLALLLAWPGVAAQLSPLSQSPASHAAAAPLPGLFSPARGNLMFWKTHKVGGTTLRHVLLRRQAALNLTLGVLGCTRQREPSRAHLSASHVVCQQRTRSARFQPGRLVRPRATVSPVRPPGLLVALSTQGCRPRFAAGQELLGGARPCVAPRAAAPLKTRPHTGCVCARPCGPGAVRLLLHHHVPPTDRCRQRGACQPALWRNAP